MASTAVTHGAQVQDEHGHHRPNHPYHLVDPSPWPLVASFSALLLTGGGVMWMHGSRGGPWVTLLGFLGVIYVMFRWWGDVLREGRTGHHTDVVAKGLRLGMALFITSEVLFFFAFFWAFFWGALYPPMTIATSYPPEGVHPVATWNIPFLNTLILLLSGATVTWAHHAIKENDQQTAFKALLLTVCLGLTFTAFQAYEYIEAISEGFTLSDGIYGSTFYLATGFHGLHVQIGTIFLIVCMIRAWYGTFSPDRHVGFEAAAWYWHFVDVVWLFLFVWVYWWGGHIHFTTQPVG
ncbi:cytochrome c oxidase subunit 3 [Benzoatithermus flavus]|uniref:cytochrome-c oxidase n=1 Tax=Benzoatithermus flavus TaxID=3108223 RepID=A0ABU8XQ01_9PROT